MHIPGRKREAASVDPRRPHEFRQGKDAGIAALTPIGGGVGRQVSDIASAGAYTRSMGCAVPGCGRPHDDPIHEPAE